MDELLKRLQKTFLGELDERVRALNSDLLALESGPAEADRATLLNSLFRSAHSLKGAAASVDIGPIEAVCHNLEEIFAAGREHRLEFRPELTDLLLTTVDAIAEAGDGLRKNEDIAEGPLATLLPRLVAAAGDGSAAGPAMPAVPHVEPGPVLSLMPNRDSNPASPAADSEPHASALSPLLEPSAVLSPQEPELVRVGADKLDVLLARSGELMVAQRRAAARGADFSELHNLVRSSRQRTLSGQGAGRGAVRSPMPRRRTDQQKDSAVDHAAENLRRFDRELERFGTMLAADHAVLEHAIGAIDAEIRRARMQPLAEVCVGLTRTVRDLARACGKSAQLFITGGDVELDRSILDRLKDPLLHLVRNAVDHGIETPEQRRALGKPPQGEIRISASLHSNTVEIVVDDDGAGLNLSAIREHARQLGLPDTDDALIGRNIFLPGFSTSLALTRVSGRGVGLDAVRSGVEQMRGVVGVASVPGSGTKFTLKLPLTLTTVHAVVVRAGGETYALDSGNIMELQRIAVDSIRSVGGRDMISVGGRLVPILSLASLLAHDITDQRAATAKFSVVVIGVAGSDVALVVDELLDEQELVIRSLGSRLKQVRHIAGATILPNGRVALILNSAELIATALDLRTGRSLTPEVAAAAIPARRRLLLVEDSVTTRTLESSILESAGYEVTAVADGVDAWSALQQSGADLVVSDVDMPRMDGIALTEMIRSSKRFHALPVVLVTGRSNDEEKARGLAVGADAYLAKSGFDQQVLLETVGQLL